METSAGAQAAPQRPQERVAAHLSGAFDLRRRGDVKGATERLETALAEAHSAPFEIEFRTRVDVAITLAELYLAVEEIEKARLMLGEEAQFAERIFQLVQAGGTPEQRRAAAGGRVQLRDRARQVEILGTSAPEISVKTWIGGEAATLEDLRGRVVLLEFWATWCKPCAEMFPKLRALDAEYRARGLEIIALTRHYMAYRATAASQEDELELMRKVVREHGLSFRVGVSEDERTQELYGATGLPMLALIDRGGVVRYAHFGGGEDPKFKEILVKCLDATH
ncbi:MAG TPA: TlpA disulfide reductase family protein [Pyrinomonadaceae bacterium]|jgi:thiol-disulfide isomerase/thioredoxin